nr:hypothetical protein [Leucobacter coleopterorum]
MAVFRYHRKRRVGRGVVVAQYEVPASLPPLLAAPIVGSMTSAASVPAEFVHLAVSGVIRIEESEATWRPRPTIRLMDLTRCGTNSTQKLRRTYFQPRLLERSLRFRGRVRALPAA